MFHDRLPSPANGRELTHLHAMTCLLMTQFINGRHCPKLAHRIVSQLALLLSHPQLEHTAASRDMYLQLHDHWQRVTGLLLERRESGQPRYH